MKYVGGDCKINDLIFSSTDTNGSNLMLICVYIYFWNLVDNSVLIRLNEKYTIVICIKCAVVSFGMVGFRRSRKRIVIDRPGRKIKCDIYIERPILVRVLFKEYNYYPSWIHNSIFNLYRVFPITKIWSIHHWNYNFEGTNNCVFIYLKYMTQTLTLRV